MIDKDFNPRLREGGDELLVKTNELFIFQSTPPRRRRPFKPLRKSERGRISIHASEKEATSFGF